MNNLRVKDIMTKEPIVIKPDDLVVFAADILSKHDFSGLPVVSNDKILVGIITEYDLISKADALHLSTLLDVLGNISTYEKDNGPIKDNIKNLLTLKVKDIMNSDPLTIEEDAWIQEVLDLFSHHHRVNPIPVVNKERKIVGIVSRFDLVKLIADSKAGNDTDKFIKNFLKRFFQKRSKSLIDFNFFK